MKTKYFIPALLLVVGLDGYLTYLLIHSFDKAPVTREWFCLTWLAIITEVGIELVRSKITKP